MAISTIGTDALASAAVTSAKLASGAPSRSQLPAGTVLQVVQGTRSGPVATTSASLVTTNLTVSITPTSASSKIFIIAFGNSDNDHTSGQVILSIYRNSTSLSSGGFSNTYSPAGRIIAQSGMGYLDSPATTSAITYSVYFATNTAGQTATFNQDTALGSNIATITAMEIAA